MSGMTFNGPVSATTYYGDGSNLTGISTQDTFVTGGTYFTGGTLVFDYNVGGGFQVTGLTEDLDAAIAGLAETDELTIELDIATNKIRLKDDVAAPPSGTRIFQGNVEFVGNVTGSTFYGDGSNLTGIPDIYVTGATYDNNTTILTLTRNDNTQITASGWTSNDTFVTGFTNSNNVFTILDNNGQSYSTTLNTLTGLTIGGNLDVVSIDPVDYIQFYTASTQSNDIGRLIWNDADGTLDLGLKGGNVTLQIGQEQVARVVNKTGSNLLESQYRVVRIRRVDEGGSQGQRLAVVLAQANNDANSVDTLGIVTENIDNNQEGFITTSGLVRGINTTGSLQGETWLDGDLLYLSPTTPGVLTKVKPIAPQHTIIMGYVVYAHNNNGKIFVKVDNGYELDELHNVRISGATGGDTLQYNATTNVWENSHPYWTIDLMDASSVEFYAVQDTKINSITNVVGSPSIIILDDGATYTLGNTILSGSKITVTSNIQSVVKLNITY
jgi:hypothetical protein